MPGIPDTDGKDPKKPTEYPSETAFLSTKMSFYQAKATHLHLHFVDTCR